MEPRPLEHDIAGDGDLLILVPGGLTGWVSWIPHQDRLDDHHRVIRVQPIHNELGSAGQPGDSGYSAEVERESLRLTLDALDIGAADFAGWSGGARALIEFAITYPERVRSLALVEPPATWILDGMGEPDPSVKELDDFLAGLAGEEVSPDDMARFLTAAGLAPDPAEVRAHPAWENWLPHRMALSWLGFIDPWRSVEDLAAITSPVLLVKGDKTGPWQARVVDLLGQELADARVVELAGGHACHIESMEHFLQELETHLHPGPDLI